MDHEASPLITGGECRGAVRGGTLSVMDAMLKLLVEQYPPMQVTTLRGLASVPFLLLPIPSGPLDRAPTSRWHWHPGRAAIGVVMLCTFIFAVERLSLANTYAIFMCAPLLIAALSCPCFANASADRTMGGDRGRTGRRAGDAAPTGSGWATLGGLAAVCRRSAMPEVRSRSECCRAPRRPRAWCSTSRCSSVSGPACSRCRYGDRCRSPTAPDRLASAPAAHGPAPHHRVPSAMPPRRRCAVRVHSAAVGRAARSRVWNVLAGDTHPRIGGAVVIAAGLYLIVREHPGSVPIEAEHP